MAVLQIEDYRRAFEQFLRPAVITVHAADESCFDCPSVNGSLGSLDCARLLAEENSVLAYLPLDCLNADAWLHFFPAIVKYSVRPEYAAMRATVLWVLTVDSDDWDRDETISMQMKPGLNREQQALIATYLECLCRLNASP